MGRHTKPEPPEDEPGPGAQAPSGPFFGAPLGSSYEVFSGPTDDQVFVSDEQIFVSSYEPPVPPAGHDFGARPQFSAPGEHAPPPGHGSSPHPGTGPQQQPGYGVQPPPPSQPQYGAQPQQAAQPYPFGRPSAHSAAHLAAPYAVQPNARLPDEPEPVGGGPSRRGRLVRLFAALPVPMLPIVALVIAVGVVAYALSTQQISLNFAGGAPREQAGNPQGGQMSDRNPGSRASRGTGRTDGVVVAFRVASKLPGGFRATATVTNHGRTAVSRWALAFRIPDVTVRTVGGAAVVRTGTLAFVRGRGPLAPGQSVKVVFTARGVAKRPTYCVLNSRPCAFG